MRNGTSGKEREIERDRRKEARKEGEATDKDRREGGEGT